MPEVGDSDERIRASTAGLAGRRALVTGASGGIGGAIAAALAAEGAALCLVGRNEGRLASAERQAQRLGAVKTIALAADLGTEDALHIVAAEVKRGFAGLDILVHAAGVYERGPVETLPTDFLDHQYRVNLRAPYLLTQLLLPALHASGGDIIFINSSQGVAAGAELAQYAATQHSRKALADSLRAEVNAEGVRVLTLFLGRTATGRMAQIFAREGRAYTPQKLLQPADVAAMLVAVLRLPRRAEVTEIAMRPAEKSY
jgi:short-subunit dehydrogenase